jgi:predicted nucleotidyltransferase
VVTRYAELLRVLSTGHVRYIVIGGVAAIAHGSARFTQDVDVIYDRAADNIERLVAVLAPYSPYPRGAPKGLPFRWDAETVAHGLNFTLETTIGDLDLLGEVSGGGTYPALVTSAQGVTVYGITCLCVSLPDLIALKRAAGRPKDHEMIAELEALLEESRKQQP